MYKLDCKDTGGVVGKPVMGTSASSPKPMTVSITSPMGSMDTGANLSAKYKTPNVSAPTVAKGEYQYE